MITNERAQIIIKKLKKAYPHAGCTLLYENPLQLLVAIMLSAQCTDARVNLVTPTLFEKFKSLKDFADASPSTIEKHIYSCGFYHTKAQNIVNMCKIIVNDFGSQIPSDFQSLIFLPGIGRKTANLFLGEVYGIPGLVVDTHFIRITNRLGFHKSKDASKIEKIMNNFVLPKDSLGFCHRIVRHGRLVCTAKSPKCIKCCLRNVCKYFLDRKDL